MYKNTALAVLFAGGAVLGLTACGSETAPAAPVQQTQDKQAKDTETKPKDTSELKKDVKIVACEAGVHGGVRATLEVTNSQPTAMEYYGRITFLDASGAEVAEGVFNTGTLRAGEKGTEEIPGANVYTAVKGPTCQVAEVKLDEPE